MNVLVTGGAGFIGTKLVQQLSSIGMEVTVLDCLSAQVHGKNAAFGDTLRKSATCIRGDVRDRALVRTLVRDSDVIVHLAAETGTGQSMYDVSKYESVNIGGTSTLVDVLVNDRPKRLKKLVVASSRAIYGEGQYRCMSHGKIYPPPRTLDSLKAAVFDLHCPICNAPLTVEATREDAPKTPSSFYGLTKHMQEQTVLMFASALGIDAVALRYQNVYGPGQSLSNPYTGILAIFANLARKGDEINVFEDGFESRDFVYIDDVVDATTMCITEAVSGVDSVNVGSGSHTTVVDVAKRIVDFFGADSQIRVSGDFRIGDIRHNLADITRLRERYSFTPKWNFERGLQEFLRWTESNTGASDAYRLSISQLKSRGLLLSAS